MRGALQRWVGQHVRVTCVKVLKELGIPMELCSTMREVLQVSETKHEAENARKKTLHVKALRRDNKKKRTSRDAGAAGGAAYLPRWHRV